MNKQGYTLLEVTLFMAISSLLTLVAFVGLGPRLRNVRFTSAVRGLESGVQSQIIATQSGVNDVVNKCTKDGNKVVINSNPSGATGTSQDCVINGTVVVFREGSVTYYPIVSLREKVTGDNGAIDKCEDTDDNSFQSVLCYSPTILDSATSGVTNVEYSNGVKNSTGSLAAFGYIQDPNSSSTYTFVFQNTSDYFDSTILTPGYLNQLGTKGSANQNERIAQLITANSTADTCLTLSGRSALFQMQTGTTKPKVTFGGC